MSRIPRVLPHSPDSKSGAASVVRLDSSSATLERGSNTEKLSTRGTRSSVRGQVVAGRSAKLLAEEILAAFLAEACDARRAAARLGVCRRSFDRWTRRHGLQTRLADEREELLVARSRADAAASRARLTAAWEALR